MAQDTVVTPTVETSQNTVVTPTVEISKASKKVDLSSKIPEKEEIGGYVTSKYAAKILSQHSGKDIPVTTVNNLAYAGKIECIKVAGIFLFKLDGEKSVNAYKPSMTEISAKKEARLAQSGIKEQQKKAKELFAKYVNDAIAQGKMPDLEALRKELGIE